MMKPHTHPVQPFWRFRIHWLVIGLPLSAVVAGTATLFIALAHPDPVVRAGTRDLAQRPAVEGRNHAATGGQVSAAPAR
jgi:hypothetical protein